jgi:hypothetical protein
VKQYHVEIVSSTHEKAVDNIHWNNVIFWLTHPAFLLIDEDRLLTLF